MTSVSTLRRAGPESATLLARILVQTWRARYPGLVPAAVLDRLSEERFVARFASVLAPSTGHHASVAAVDGDDVGFIHFGPDEDDPADGHVYSLYVMPPHSGGGLGRELLAHALAELSREGRRAVTLWVFKDNAPTVRMYERAGFRRDGAERVEPDFGVLEQRLRLDLDRSDEWRRLVP